MSACDILSERVALLDQGRDDQFAWGAAQTYALEYSRDLLSDDGAGNAGSDISVADMAYFIYVTDRITDTSGPMVLVSPYDADQAFGQSHLLARLRDSVPEISLGRLARESQYWIGTSGPDHQPAKDIVLRKSDYNHIPSESSPATKPFEMGLFTSTKALGKYGMWHIYLELNRNSTLFRRPWSIFSIAPANSAVVCEISSAHEWADFVDNYPVVDRDLVYPNWPEVARDYDGIHMTIGAVAATQGFFIKSQRGIIAPTFWGVESTFWLNWIFTDYTLIRVIE